MKPIRSSYFGRMLAYFLIFSLVPLLVLGLLSYGLARMSLEEELRSRAQAGIQRFSEGVDRLVVQHSQWLGILSEDVDVYNLLTAKGEENYYRCNYKLMLTTGGASDLFAVHVVGAEDRIYATTKTVPQNYLYPYNQGWGIFRKAGESDDVVVHAGTSDLNNPYDTVVSLGKAVRDTRGEIVGYVVIDMMRDNFTPLVSDSFQHDLYLVDSSNFVAFASRGSAWEGVGGLPEELRAPLLAGQDQYAAADGSVVELLRHPSGLSGLVVVSQVPLGQVDQNIQVIRQLLTWISLATFAGSLLAAYLVARNVSRPIQTMTGLMQRVEGGDFTVSTDFSRQDEIGIMGRAFNHMTGQLQELIQKVEEKQRSLRLAEIQALQAQVNPHFLYNTLDLIKWSAKMGDVDQVSHIAVQLGKLLRYLADNREDMVSLNFELEFIHRYMAIQQVRFGGRLQVEQQVDEALLPLMVPKLILQPAVENAVIHGLEDLPEGGTLTIRGCRKADYMVFTIADDGKGIPPEKLRELLDQKRGRVSGIGLGNVDARAKLYGDARCGIDIRSTPGQGTVITITLLVGKGGENT